MVYLVVAARWLLALILLSSGAGKLADRKGSKSAVARYELVPGRFAGALSNALLVLELVLGITLAAGIAPLLGGWCASAAFVAFAAAVAVNLRRGRRFDCGCGGVLQREISWTLVVRNVVLALLAAAVAVRPDGLSLWTAGLAVGQNAPPARDLVAIPLAVVAVTGTARCASAYRAATRTIDNTTRRTADLG